VLEKIKEYWEVQPPFKGEGKYGSCKWSRSISEHRFKVIPYWKEFLNAPAYKGKKILEIGCGAGSDLLEYAKAGASVFGIDITDTAIDLAKIRFRVEKRRANLLTYNGENLNRFNGCTFDMVCSYGVLHHTPYMEDLLVEAHRVLKKGGELRLMLYNKNSFLYYYSILYLRKFLGESGLSRTELLSKYSEFREDCPYTRCYSEFEIRDMLWYFSEMDVQIDYPVYDGINPMTDRKLSYVDTKFNIEPTGIADIDAFFEVNKTPLNGKELGWHLLVKAIK